MDDNAVADGDIFQPKPLADFCMRTLMRNYDALGDLGWHITPVQLRRIMHPCSRSHLETIEDSTLEGSGRDITWYTWHLWYKVYIQRYGSVRDDTELLPLPGEPPLDYEPPVGIKCPQADYRAMIMQREEVEAARKAAAVQKLRGSYQVEAQKRAMQGTDFTTKTPPAKRGRFGPAAQQHKAHAAAMAHKTIGGKPVVKVLNDLGVQRARSGGRGFSSNRGSSNGSRKLGSSGSSRPGYLAPRPTPPKQPQQSALACLARKKPPPAAAAAKGRPAAAAPAQPRPISAMQQQRMLEQQQLQREKQEYMQLQKQRKLEQQASLGMKHGGSSSSSKVGFLDTPMPLTSFSGRK